MVGAIGAGAAANVVGGLLQSVAASMAKRAQEQEFSREIQRQQRLRNEAFGTFQPSLQTRGVETARSQIAEGAQKREAFYDKVGQTRLGLGEGPTKRDKGLYDLLGRTRANLQGYSDWALDQLISNIRTQDELNRIASFASGEAGVFPFRMEEAGHAGDELAFWGALISSLGGGASSFIPQGTSTRNTRGSAFGGQGSPPNTGFGVPYDFTSPFVGQV
jgi:hypothetical protein